MAEIISQLRMHLADIARHLRETRHEHHAASVAAVERILERRRAERAQEEMLQARRERAERLSAPPISKVIAFPGKVRK
jgi:hypothetical protein